MSIVIVGAGPNLGIAIGRRFGREGLAVGLISRTQSKLDDLARRLQEDGITAAGVAADIRDSGALGDAIGRLAGRLGAVEVLEFSPLPAREFMKPILDTTVEDLRGPLEFSVLGAAAATRAVVGPMLQAGSGTILFTTGGAAINPIRRAPGWGSRSRERSPMPACSMTSFATAACTSLTRRLLDASRAAPITSPTILPRLCGDTTPAAPSFRSGSESPIPHDRA
jgi:NAD(P)-dependent dehydrogenase (short-subunit alcohol dehydrogenase family)